MEVGEMKIFANEINNNYFRNLVSMVNGSSKLEVAVAYITDETIFAEAVSRNISVNVWTLVNEETDIRTLDILKKYSQNPKFKISIFRDNFHSKAIWFHGVGCYIGSANLSDSALNKNIELGIFIDQDDESHEKNFEDLKTFFRSLKDYSVVVDFDTISKIANNIKSLHSNEAVKKLKSEIRNAQKDKLNELNELLNNLFKNARNPNRNQTQESLSKHRFITEWRDSIQLLQEIATEYNNYGSRPDWIPTETCVNVEIDRMLSWYYDNHVKDRSQGNVYEIIETLHDENQGNGKVNLEIVFRLWKNLKVPPDEYYVDFFKVQSPLVETLLSQKRVLGLNDSEMAVVVVNCHALAGRIDKFIGYETLGIKKDGRRASVSEKASAYVKSELAGVNSHGRKIHEVLNYFIWGDGALEQRLWGCLDKNSEHYFPGIGKSTLGELIGRARPNEYPIRNDRISRTLYALGFDIDYK